MTIQVSEIPLSPQSQIVTVNIGNTTYILDIIWRDPYGYFMDINDKSNTPLVQGIPLVAGLDLLAQYQYLGIIGEWVILSDQIQNQDPTFSDLGVSVHLCIATEV